MVGATGIGPVNGEFRARCLTAWLRPNNKRWRELVPGAGLEPA